MRDLSPNYLSIAMYKYFENYIQLLHANIEFTEVMKESFDIVVICYVFHEMIPEAI
jgi:ubiquinone/menaquinone biosynthesis C-methylase UbiE